MALIRPCADLRNNYNEISRICHETKQPIFITRNGTNDLVVLSDSAYETIIQTCQETEEERIEKLVSEKFDKHYSDFETFKKEVFKNIEIAIKEIEHGKGIPMQDIVAEMEAKYNIL